LKTMEAADKVSSKTQNPYLVAVFEHGEPVVLHVIRSKATAYHKAKRLSRTLGSIVVVEKYHGIRMVYEHLIFFRGELVLEENNLSTTLGDV
jgi:hypothetical protein